VLRTDPDGECSHVPLSMATDGTEPAQVGVVEFGNGSHIAVEEGGNANVVQTCPDCTLEGVLQVHGFTAGTNEFGPVNLGLVRGLCIGLHGSDEWNGLYKGALVGVVRGIPTGEGRGTGNI